MSFLASRDREKFQISSVVFSWLLLLFLSTKPFALISRAIFGKVMDDFRQKGEQCRSG
jgi:hypothetical protein